PRLEKVRNGITDPGGLLSDVPELREVEATVELPRMQVSQAATEAIADQYERELRQRLDEASARKTFWQAHWWKIAIGAVLAVVLAVVPASYIRTRIKNKGKDLKDALAYAKKEIVRDTPQSYRDALASLNDALNMDDSTEEAWALSGYVRSILYAEYGVNSD